LDGGKLLSGWVVFSFWELQVEIARER